MFESDYLPISVATLLPSACVGLDLYQQGGDLKSFVLYREKSLPLVPQDLRKLYERGVRRLFIEKSARAKYQKYLRHLTTMSAEDESVPMSTRLGAMNEVVCDVLTNSLGASDAKVAVEATQRMGVVVAETVSSSRFAFQDLMNVLKHDYTTFTHSANVAFYNAVLAERLGYTKEEISQIAMGGLLHDIGKLEVDEDILCKPGKLDAAEYREVKKHPLNGFRKLALRTEVAFGQLMMVYQHHERIDGRGYPVGCAGDEIHTWAKQCAVVDVYEALTSLRPYRPPMPNTKALEIMHRDCGTAFDPEILACWTTIIQNDLIPSSDL